MRKVTPNPRRPPQPRARPRAGEDTAPGRDPRSRPGDVVMPLALRVLCRRAGVWNDLAEVVEAHDGRTTSADAEVVLGQQRPILRVTPEVGGRTRQIAAEPPHAAVVTLLTRNAVLEGAVERVEGHRGALVRGRQLGAPHTGEPARPALDSRNVGLECRA